jgi:hypothetical protein
MRALDLGGHCNNNCFACESRKGGWAKLTDIYRADYLKGEATLHPEFMKILAMPRKTIETNGRAFSYMPLAMKARGHSWLVKISGPDARTHDSLTRTKGSFSQAVSGLKNLISAGSDNAELPHDRVYRKEGSKTRRREGCA